MSRPVFFGFAIIRPDGDAVAAVFRTREAAIARARGFILSGGKIRDVSDMETDWEKLKKIGFSIQKIEVWTATEIRPT